MQVNDYARELGRRSFTVMWSTSTIYIHISNLLRCGPGPGKFCLLTFQSWEDGGGGGGSCHTKIQVKQVIDA